MKKDQAFIRHLGIWAGGNLVKISVIIPKQEKKSKIKK